MLFSHDPDYVSTYIDNYMSASVNLLDATNVRLRNLSLSYKLDDRLCSKIHINGIKLQFNAENLFTIAMSKQAKYMLGGYTTPTYTVGLQLNF